MLSSFTKLHKGRKSSKNDSTVTSVHGQSVRPVHIIAENKTDSVQHPEVQTGQACGEVNAQEENEPSPFDEVSLSTHSSYEQVPIETVFICNEEGKILSGNDEFGPYEDAQAVDSAQGTPKKDQGKVAPPKETDGDDLSFNADGAVLDGSVLDRVFDDFKEKPNTNTCNGSESDSIVNPSSAHGIATATSTHVHKADESPKLLVEDNSVDNFNNQAFANIGKAMFKQQPETQHSKASSVGSNRTSFHSDGPPEVKKKLFDKEAEAKEFGILFKIDFAVRTVLAFFTLYGIMKFVSKTKLDDSNYYEAKDHHDICSEESFHYAMYQLSSITDGMTTNHGSPYLDSNHIRPSLTVIGTLILYHGVMHICKTFWRKKEQPIKSERSRSRRATSKATPKTKPRLKREIISLDKKHVFASTFSTEVISPTGSIASVKRSSRVKSSCSKIAECKIEESEAATVRVDLFAAFDLEPKKGGNVGLKSKVKAEKI